MTTTSPPPAAQTADDDGGGILPPFSGSDTPCPKCAYPEALTSYRRAHGRMILSEWNGRVEPRGPLPARLERQCGRCDYTWDESLCPPSCGMTVRALAHAIDNAIPYPFELSTAVCELMAEYLLGCLYVAARPDHPLWQYDAGRPPEPPIKPAPAESCPASQPEPDEGDR